MFMHAVSGRNKLDLHLGGKSAINGALYIHCVYKLSELTINY